jgi:hypothetical protein
MQRISVSEDTRERRSARRPSEHDSRLSSQDSSDDGDDHDDDDQEDFVPPREKDARRSKRQTRSEQTDETQKKKNRNDTRVSRSHLQIQTDLDTTLPQSEEETGLEESRYVLQYVLLMSHKNPLLL